MFALRHINTHRPDSFMVSPEYRISSIKWQLKGGVVSPARVFSGKCLCLEWDHLLHAEPAVWSLSAALEKATLQLANGEETQCDI